MLLFIYDLFSVMYEFGRKQLPIELCLCPLAHIERQCFQVRVDTECKLINVLGSNSCFAISG